MNSLVGVVSTHGSRFGAAVPSADEVSAREPKQKPSLPDDTVSILMELKPTPEEKQELANFISERFDLNTRTLEFVTRLLTRMHADLEAAHELAKQAVVEGGKVLDGLKEQLVEGSQEFLRCHNAFTKTQTAAWNAEQELKGLSRFASKKDIAEAERRVEQTRQKMEAAEAKMAEAGQAMNHLKMVTIPAENKKLARLMEREIAIDNELVGRDPILAKFGFQQR